MFPFFEIFSGFKVYTFGITLTLCYLLFVWMFNKLSIRFGSDYSIFSKNIVWYFLSVFLFSRIFYVIGNWNELKYITDPYDFFIMSDYNFSLVGAFIGFLTVLLINLRLRKEKLDSYIDATAIAFIFILFIGFAGSILGGQVYGTDTHFGIEILYTHSFTPIPYQVAIFPLPIIYSILFFILFSTLYILSMYIHIRSLLGYMGLIATASLLLIFDFFSGKHDIFKDTIGMNMTQFFSIFLIIFCSYRVFLIMNDPSSKKDKTLIS